MPRAAALKVFPSPPMSFRVFVKTFFLCLYLLRVQILGFACLWPISSLVIQTPMFRGLVDIQTQQFITVAGISLIFVGFLICSTNSVLRYGRERIAVAPDPGEYDSSQYPPFVSDRWMKHGIPIFGLSVWVLFLLTVAGNWTIGKVLGAVGFGSVGIWLIVISATVENALVPRVDHKAEFDTFMERLHLRDGLLRVVVWLIQGVLLFYKTLVVILLRYAEKFFGSMLMALGPGYARGGRVHPGHLVSLVLFFYFLIAFYSWGLSFGRTESRWFGFTVVEAWETGGSTLLLGLFGVQFAIGVMTMLTFYFDRHRVPITLIIAVFLTVTSTLNSSESTFYAKAVEEAAALKLLSPRQVIEDSPSRIVVVAAAGGGIQASGWTAEVLSRLSEENATFRKHLRVISGVSGGSVGTVFYLASYEGVWREKPWSMDQVRKGATSSFLEDVAWGLVYPDLHRLFLPIPLWRSMDRGKALEAAFSRAAGNQLNPTMLSLAPKVAEGLPVIILNATLTDKALPVVFTNARFPDPDGQAQHRRSIRSFWDDYRLDTHLETAARISASFPYISPAARPQSLPGMDAFVDGGFFDNSGIYSLMAWLEQASHGLDASKKREVLFITIDAFPEPGGRADRRTSLRWYDQLLLPLTTVIGVRESGQAARTQYEFPLLAKSLDQGMRITSVNFRYNPSPQCALDPPPLSWRLTEFEKNCIAEGWTEHGVRNARRLVSNWLQN